MEKTIILKGMPNLEWAPANLTGHGGMKINGNWYYTWEQAMAAAKELGDGWRLPTAGELQRLCDAGSTWDDNGPDGMPGRWFGGNHATDHSGSLFFPAAGVFAYTLKSMTRVGLMGRYWSNRSLSTILAICLHFCNGLEYTPYNTYRGAGLTIRCVREVK